MNKKFILITLVVIISLIFSGCASQGKFSAISTKIVDLSNLKINQAMMKGNTSGEDCAHIIIFIPTQGDASLQEAIDRALEAKQANILLNSVVNYHWFYIPLIYGQKCWKVEGTAYDTFISKNVDKLKE